MTLKRSNKYALYRRHYNPATITQLKKWGIVDFVDEIQLLRVCLDLIADGLLVQDLGIKDKIALVKAITYACRAISMMINAHQKFSQEDNPIMKSWLETLDTHEFFDPNLEDI